MHKLRGLQRDVDALEARVADAVKPDTVDLFCAALHGNNEAAAELRALGEAGRAGCLHQALDAVLTPLQAAGGSLVADEDLVRPEA